MTDSLQRIRSAPTHQDAVAQAAVEQIVLLHSIRQILVWTAVILPLLLLALGLVVMLAGASASTCTGTYNC